MITPIKFNFTEGTSRHVNY